MPTTEFVGRVLKHLDRIDRHALERYVHDLAREKQFLTTLLDKLPYGAMVLSMEQKCLYLNRRMMQILNLPDSIRPMSTLSEMISDRTAASWIAKKLLNREEVYHEELEMLLPRPMLLEISIVFASSEDSNFSILFLSNMSQTERNARERFQVENWRSMLSLAAGVAHEIGNPLNSLIIHLTLVSKALNAFRGKDRPKIFRSLKAMKEETMRLDAVVRNFLTAARRKPLKFELVQINELLRKTLDFMTPELQLMKIKIVKTFDLSLEPFLLDAERIRQVFLNIIKNAIHAMPKGGTLRIETEFNFKLCTVSFEDTGHGIPEDQLPRIFDAYYTTREEGSGLGLLIVYQIIREHGGRIEVASKLGLGTTFTVTLPVRREKLGLPEPKARNRK